jgi:hypothetical protein
MATTTNLRPSVGKISDGVWHVWVGESSTDGRQVGGDFKTSELANAYLNSTAILNPQDGQKYYAYSEKDDQVAPIQQWDNNNPDHAHILKTNRLFKTKEEAERFQEQE